MWQLLQWDSKYTARSKRRSSYIGFKDMQTFGIVHSFAHVPSHPPMVLFHKLQYHGNEYHGLVHLLELDLEPPLCVLPVTSVFSRIAVLKPESSAVNGLIRATFIPKYVNNDLSSA